MKNREKKEDITGEKTEERRIRKTSKVDERVVVITVKSSATI